MGFWGFGVQQKTRRYQKHVRKLHSNFHRKHDEWPKQKIRRLAKTENTTIGQNIMTQGEGSNVYVIRRIYEYVICNMYSPICNM